MFILSKNLPIKNRIWISKFNACPYYFSTAKTDRERNTLEPQDFNIVRPTEFVPRRGILRVCLGSPCGNIYISFHSMYADHKQIAALSYAKYNLQSSFSDQNWKFCLHTSVHLSNDYGTICLFLDGFVLKPWPSESRYFSTFVNPWTRSV